MCFQEFYSDPKVIINSIHSAQFHSVKAKSVHEWDAKMNILGHISFVCSKILFKKIYKSHFYFLSALICKGGHRMHFYLKG